MMQMKEETAMVHEIDFACSLSVVAWRSYESGNSESAKALYRRALRVFQRSQEKNESEVAAILLRLGGILENNREFSEAGQCFGRACDLLESLEGDKRVARLRVRALYHFGRIRRIQGCNSEAESLLKKAVYIAEAKLGSHDVDFALALNQLAMYRRQVGDLDHAKANYYRALRILEASSTLEDEKIASVYHNLADLEYARSRYAKGEPFARRAALIRMKVLGPEHPDVAHDLSMLASLLQAQGKFKEAEKLYTRGLSLIQAKYSMDHYEVAIYMFHLATLHVARCEYQQAEWLFWQALTIKEKNLGPNHTDCAMTALQLADLYKNQRKFEEAQILCHKALVILEKVLEPDNPQLVRARQSYAWLCQLEETVA
jgi:tetratricopeptide (TPR) repeat protein